MKFVQMISEPAAWVDRSTSAVLCFSVATGFWLAGACSQAICWIVGTAEVLADYPVI